MSSKHPERQSGFPLNPDRNTNPAGDTRLRYVASDTSGDLASAEGLQLTQRGSVEAEADRQCRCSMKDGIVDRRESGPQKARSIMKNVFIFIALFLRLCIPLHSPLRNTRQSSARSRVIPERFPVAFAVLSFGFLYRSVFPEWRSRGSIMLNFWKYWFHVFGSGFCSERRILNLQLGQGPVMLQTN